MHIILLKFAQNKSAAAEHMDAHNAWIAQGFSDGVFQAVGSLDSGGGAVLASGQTRSSLEARVGDDPFVKHGVVSAEILGVDLKRTVPALEHLKAAS